jgi:hypothetical protein
MEDSSHRKMRETLDWFQHPAQRATLPGAPGLSPTHLIVGFVRLDAAGFRPEIEGRGTPSL